MQTTIRKLFYMTTLLLMLSFTPDHERSTVFFEQGSCQLNNSSRFVDGCEKELHVYLTNAGSRTLDVWVALRRTDGTWDTGMEFDLRPGKQMTYWGCNCSGKWFYMCRIPNSGDTFPDTQYEIDEQFRRVGGN